MAKQHRMAALTVACLVSALLEPLWGWRGQTLMMGRWSVVALEFGNHRPGAAAPARWRPAGSPSKNAGRRRV